MEPILTAKTKKRNERNSRIQHLYVSYMGIPGSQRVAVAERVASELHYNYNMVMRVTSELKIN